MQSSVRGARAKFFLAVTILAAFVVVACNALLDFESYKVGAPDGGSPGTDASDSSTTTDGPSTTDAGDASVGDGGCIDPTGFNGLGCYRCTPTTNEQLLSACTTSKFETFDNAVRIKNYNGVQKPPLEDGGPTPPNFDAGPSGAGTPTSDAGCPFDDPTKPNPVIVLGATGFPMDTIAKAMGDQATIYYLETGSCLGVGAAVLNTPKIGVNTSGPNFQQLVYFDKNNNGAAVSCRLPDNVTMAADIALSGSFPDTCSGTDVGGGATLPTNTQLPTGWKDNVGAINPVMFAVPATSTERVISAEAAYRVFGFGSGTSALSRSVTPWVDESFIFRRTKTSGTQQSIARTLSLPPDALRGTNATGSSAMRKAFQLSSNVQATIGINSSEVVDSDRTSMKSLAYKHFNQPVGFYPDSDPGSYDRRNVRDGHYLMWIALHIFSRVDGTGDPVSAGNTLLETGGTLTPTTGKTRAERDAAVKRLVFVLANRQEPPVKTVDLFNAYKQFGDVPICAMKVTRPTDGAELTPFTPPTSCGCAFEAAPPGAIPADCKQCLQPSDCTGAKSTCSFGFCE